MTEALKPCPFCGEQQPPHDDTSWVHCLGCGAESGWRPTGDEAIAAWNARADLVDPAAIREAALREAAELFGDSVTGQAVARCILALIDKKEGA